MQYAFWESWYKGKDFGMSDVGFGMSDVGILVYELPQTPWGPKVDKLGCILTLNSLTSTSFSARFLKP